MLLRKDTTISMSEFLPPGALRNPHVQSILASTRLRRLRLLPATKNLLQASKSVVLDCGDGHQLLGEYSPQATRSRGLVTLIHGWEGSSRSTYLLSAGSALYRAGYDVFRLNLRDHGPSHHLNHELFNSARLDEVVGAMRAIQDNYGHDWQFLAGFSLGGNFALRVAARAGDAGLRLQQTVAVCPVVDPANTMGALEQGWWLYEKYFVRKWKRSLKRKLDFYPDLGYRQHLLELNGLRAMNEYFVPHHTPFPDVETYFHNYSLLNGALETLATPAHIIATQDDPIILAEDMARLPAHDWLSLEIKPFGGHCGFVSNYRLDSWLDQRLIEVINLRRYDQAAAH